MAGSETGLMATRESMAFTMNLHQQTPSPSSQAQPVIQNMQIPYVADGTSLYKPVNSTSPPPPQYQTNSTAAGDNESSLDPVLNMNTISSETVKKKRGRPRKYGPDGAMSLSPFTISQPSGERTSSTYKKMRGRPPGSSKKRKLQTLGSTGLGFTPHVLTVRSGEDVTSKIMSFSQNGPRAVCVLSANGAISNVTLRQPATSGGTVTYEGRFEILSLTGSFLLLENGGHRSRTGGLSVSLSDVDGNVLGGGVAGLLTAASPIQIVVGSFIPDGQKEVKNVGQMELLSSSVPRLAPTQVLMAPSSPHSRGTMSESSCGGGPGSPLNQSTGVYNNTSLSMPWK